MEVSREMLSELREELRSRHEHLKLHGLEQPEPAR
jgi:hypothetical protein